MSRPLRKLIPGAEPYAHTLAVATVVVVITYLSLIVGELVPKSIALSDPEKWATRLSPLMVAVKNISYPFVLLLSASTKLVNKLIGLEEGSERQMTQDELKMILHQGSEQGVIDKDAIRQAIVSSGYDFLSYEYGPYESESFIVKIKGLFS